MDFCVRCGVKNIYREFLCRACYEHVHIFKKAGKKKVRPFGKKTAVGAEAGYEKEESGMERASEIGKKKIVKKHLEQKHAGYFEAVLQLRGINSEVADFALVLLRNSPVEIAKEKWYNLGADFYLSKKAFAGRIAKKLQQRYGGKIKFSKKLFATDRLKSKLVYRVTVLFKRFPHEKGGIFRFKGENYKVITVNTAVVAETEAGKKITLRFDSLERDRVF